MDDSPNFPAIRYNDSTYPLQKNQFHNNHDYVYIYICNFMHMQCTIFKGQHVCIKAILVLVNVIIIIDVLVYITHLY